MKLKETFIKRKVLARGNILDFVMDTVTLPDKKTATREFILNPKAAAVIPLIDSKHVVMVKQYRYPLKRATYEIPAGKVDKGETYLACIKRELEEEAGYRASKIKQLLYYFPTPAFSTENLKIYIATGLKPVQTRPDEDEFIERHIISIDMALQWIKTNKIYDSKTIIALLYYKQFVERNR
ncbi:MAG: hypothetical protein A2252_01630 [Elusimicrobia bacterium RIFOXYA2_FULL_39_19]|nr:MAG: hypothetical protein A2252_01630 [Elusimicrobia bacterium RIFOXYA2_FULL_39_19]